MNLPKIKDIHSVLFLKDKIRLGIGKIMVLRLRIWMRSILSSLSSSMDNTQSMKFVV